MCGIVASVERGGFAPSTVFTGLKEIEYRGYDSWGIAYATGQGLQVVKRAGFLPETLDLPESQLAIGHTRWATHGIANAENAHPHLDCSQRLAVAHNGIIENYLELKNGLKGHQFASETDTEVLIHLVEDRFVENGGDLLDATAYSYRQLSGRNTLVIASQSNIVAVRDTTPLILGEHADGFAIASDTQAMIAKTNRFYYLNDQEVAILSQDQDARVLRLADVNPFKITFTEVPTTEKVEKKSFPHFMIKEINEQPEILRSITQNGQEAKQVAELIKKAFGTFFIACGSAGFAAQEGVYLFSKIAKKHVNFSVGSEFNYLQDYIVKGSLLIAVSQGGETVDTLEPAAEAKKKGASLVVLVNKVDSPLFRMADYPVPLRAGVEKAVASTKVVTSMLANMIMIAYSAVGTPWEGQEIVRKSADEVENVIAKEQAVSDLADFLKDYEHIYCLGRGLSFPVALEASLKMKEVSYIHAEGVAGGELKHGMIALIEPGSPVIVFAPNDETKEVMMDNAMEVKSRGAYVIGVSPKDHPVFDYHFKVEDSGASSIIPNIVFAQLLAYHLAILKGLDPDKPRNLAKSVVVR